MSNKNEIKLINACIRKNKEIKKLNSKINDLELNILDLIEVFQILQKYLNFVFAYDIYNRNYLLCGNFAELDLLEYEKLKNALERYGIK